MEGCLLRLKIYPLYVCFNTASFIVESTTSWTTTTTGIRPAVYRMENELKKKSHQVILSQLSQCPVPECSEYLGDVHLLRYNTLGLVLHSLDWMTMSKRVGVLYATLFRYCLALLLKMHPRAPVVFLKWESLFFI